MLSGQLEPEDESAAGTTTVLVVDDEATVRETFSDRLTADGYAVRTAADGETALATIDDDVDIVLLDRRLPDQSGDEVLSTIRARGLDCQVALVVSAEPGFDIVSVDCDDFLVRPVATADLLDTVERLELIARYGDIRRDLSSMQVKRNVLEVEKPREELEQSREFAALESRIADLKAELEGLKAEFDTRIGY